MKKVEKIYTFRIDAELLETLYEIASSQDLRINQLMRRVLREFVASEGVQKEVK